MATIEYDGHLYYDDRLYILNVAACTVDLDHMLDGDREIEYFTYHIHHENPPDKHLWCVVTYHNTERYLADRIDVFETKSEAEDYKIAVEPGCPLISLDGNGWRPIKRSLRDRYSEKSVPNHPFENYPFEDYVTDQAAYLKWKEQQDFEEYDYQKMSVFFGRPIEWMSADATPKSRADYELMKRIKKNE